jgi:hypothetical protein
MADSIREQITKAIAAKLATVTTANGYANTIASVQRFKQPGQTAVNVPVVILLEGEEAAHDGPMGGNGYTTKRLNYFLAVFTRIDSSSDSRSADEVLNDILADLEQAVMASRTWSGLAIDTTPVSIGGIEAEDGQPEVGRTMQIEVLYRHREGVPRSAN